MRGQQVTFFLIGGGPQISKYGVESVWMLEVVWTEMDLKNCSSEELQGDSYGIGHNRKILISLTAYFIS